MPEKNSEGNKIDDIIKNHVIFSMTAGAIPIPLVDFIAISAIQIDMIKQIAGHHSADYDKNRGKSLASSLAGASFAKIGASAVKALPGVGTAIGIGAQIIMAGASTYALGHVFDAHYSQNKSLSGFDKKKMKKKYNELLEKGKEFADNIKDTLKNEDSIKTIEKLKKLKDKGIITEDDFEKTKKSY